MATETENYPVKFDIEYPAKLDRVTSFFRIIWCIPAFIILSLVSGTDSEYYANEASKNASTTGGGILMGLFAATALMIVFRQRYPRWWYDFALELNRYSSRFSAYLFLLTDQYPSTEDKQSVTLNIVYPDAKQDLNRWLPLVKWLLAIPHYFALFVLAVGAIFATIIAWFAILFTGRYPKGLFDYVVGVGRWSSRVNAYAFLLTTDTYPPFSLD